MMIRTQICLTEVEKKFFDERAKKLGISMADAIRRIIDDFIAEEQEKE